MGFFDGLLGSRTAEFDSGSAATNAIELTKRHHYVSLTKQGAATGNLRVNLTWRMRTSDIGGPQRESLLRHPFKALKPPEVIGHSQSMVNVDLDLGCLYELADGTKGVVQPLGGLLGDVNAPPYVKLSGDDRFGSASGETMYVNLDHRDDIKRLLVFVYIYDQTAGVRPDARDGDAVSQQRAADRDRSRRAAPAGPVVCGRDDREREGGAGGAAGGAVRVRVPGGA